jgi:hypothetical protein
MSQPLTHPFPLRLTAEERAALDRVCEAYNAWPTPGLPHRTTRTDIARMALDRGLLSLIQELGQRPSMPQVLADGTLPHDEDWMAGGLQTFAEGLPPFDWGDTDPTRAGDPILVVPGRGAFVIA